MKVFLFHLLNHKSDFVWLVLAWLFFGFITTTLTILPIISQQLFTNPQFFASWETLGSLLTYTYNGTLGGIVNYINTFLFGFWFLTFEVFRCTYIRMGRTLAVAYHAEKSATWGGFAAILGGGCIGCGFTFLTTMFGVAMGSVLAVLPLKGVELQLVGTIIISISIIRMLRQTNEFARNNPVEAATRCDQIKKSGN